MLDLAILGLLDEHPMHGYELRKRISEMYGTIRTVSFGSLYPVLRKLRQQGAIVEAPSSAAPAAGGTAGRGASGRGKNKKPYQITEAGRATLESMLRNPAPASFGDDGFSVHLALFDRTPNDARLRILEGRRRVLEDRRESQRGMVGTPATRRYTQQLTQLGLESSERELRWINELISAEQALQTSQDMAKGD